MQDCSAQVLYRFPSASHFIEDAEGNVDLLDLCKVLGVQPGASVSDLKTAYRDLVQIWHPDRFGHSTRLNTLATEKLKEINEAYSRLMELATPSGYVPLPSRPAPPPQPAPPKPQPPRPRTAPPNAQHPPPPRPQQQAVPQQQAAPSAQSRERVKHLKVFLLLILICVLGYFPASIIEGTVEYRFSDHPHALCGNWYWQARNGSGLTLYGDGSGLSVGEGGSTRTHIHWTCRDGIMRVYSEDNPRFIDTIWTEWSVEEGGNLVCVNQGRGAEGIRSMMVLCKAI
jgi:hypothetical protein